MNFNQLIYTRLASDEDLVRILAKYNGDPAIDHLDFADDQQEGWEGKEQFPRISYRYNMQADPERSSAGTLSITIFTNGDIAQITPIEECIKRQLRNVVMKPDDGPPFCVSWMRSDTFQIEGSVTYYRDVMFDILDFPEQITADPDPVVAVNAFLKELDSDIFLISYDEMGDVYEPTDKNPAMYVSALSFSKRMETFALVYVDVTLSIHILAPSAEYRKKWSRALFNELFRRGDIPYVDGAQKHPMLIDDIRVLNTADYMRQGQIQMKCMYTMLSARIDRENNPLNKLAFETEGGEGTNGNGN